MRIPFFRAALGVALLLAASACRRSGPETQPAPAPAPAAIRTSYQTGEDVVAAMRDRYAGKWYNTLTFVQKTSRLAADGKWNVQTWLEAMRVPGRLRIDFDSATSGNGVIYARDSVFTVRNGRAIAPQPSINPLLLLGFDVYGQSAARTSALLKREGFDLSRVHSAMFENRPMIVVGARAGETRRKQFWVDAEHLYFVRLIEPTPRDSMKVQDIRFLQYRREGGGWIAPRVEIHAEGKVIFIEEYSDVKTNVTLDDALFDPSKWKTAKHWMKP
jgi:hypothetical protein